MRSRLFSSLFLVFIICAFAATCGGGGKSGGESFICIEDLNADFMCGDNGDNNSCTPDQLAGLISSANNGDVIQIACGNHSWNSPVTVSKRLTITGGGSCPDCGEEDPTGTWNWPTRLSSNKNAAFIVNAPNAGGIVRISGLFIDGDPPTHDYSPAVNTANIVLHTDNESRYRFDNLRFNHSGSEEQSAIRTNALGGFGVMDHIYHSASGQAYNSRFIHNTGDGGDNGDTDWSLPTDWNSENFHFVEDSTFIYPTYVGGNIPAGINDQQGGGRGVFRYSYIKNANSGNHGTESGWPARSGVALAFYNNTFYGGDLSDKIFAAVFMRGGSVYFHDNTIENFQEMARIWVRRVNEPFGPYGLCGSAASVGIDGPGPPPGYPCIDQFGRGRAAGVGITNTQIQAPEKAYFWNNKLINTDNAISVIESSLPYVVEGRDYEYSDNADAAPSGYTPYDYPHPLRSFN
jgi:hypothetical protein